MMISNVYMFLNQFVNTQRIYDIWIKIHLESCDLCSQEKAFACTMLVSLQAGCSTAAEYVQFILKDGDVSTLQSGFDLSFFQIVRSYLFYLFF